MAKNKKASKGIWYQARITDIVQPAFVNDDGSISLVVYNSSGGFDLEFSVAQIEYISGVMQSVVKGLKKAAAKKGTTRKSSKA